MNNKKGWLSFVRLTMIFVPLTALSLFAHLGFYTRLIADDYVTAASLKKYGYWGAQEFWWSNWSGRYSFTALITGLEFFEPDITSILPAIFIVLWLCSIGWAFFQIFELSNFNHPYLLSINVASVITWITIKSLIHYPEITFWMTGILTYSISVISLALITGYFAKRWRDSSDLRITEMFTIFFVVFLVSGFSETIVVIQISMLVTVMFFLFVQTREKWKVTLKLFSPAIVGSFLSMLVIFLAPGNSVRIGGEPAFPAAHELLSRFYESFLQALLFIPGWTRDRTVVALFAVLFGVFANVFYRLEDSNIKPSRTINTFIKTATVIFLGIWASLTPSYVIRGFAPPERALLISFFLLSCLTVYFGWVIMNTLRYFLTDKFLMGYRIAAVFTISALLWFGPISTIFAGIRSDSILKTYASLWDERDQYIRESAAKGRRRVVVKNFSRAEELRELPKDSIWILGDFDENPAYWINQGAAMYYGVDVIASE